MIRCSRCGSQWEPYWFKRGLCLRCQADIAYNLEKSSCEELDPRGRDTSLGQIAGSYRELNQHAMEWGPWKPLSQAAVTAPSAEATPPSTARQSDIRIARELLKSTEYPPVSSYLSLKLWGRMKWRLVATLLVPPAIFLTNCSERIHRLAARILLS